MDKDRFEKAEAYWLRETENADGFGMRVIPVQERHIVEVCRTPGVFGFPRQEVLEAYARHRETLNFEGKARRELMVKAVLRGWIRVRFKREPRRERWLIQADRHAERRRVIDRFLAAMRSQEYLGTHEEVEFADVAPARLTTGDRDLVLTWTESRPESVRHAAACLYFAGRWLVNPANGSVLRLLDVTPYDHGLDDARVRVFRWEGSYRRIETYMIDDMALFGMLGGSVFIESREDAEAVTAEAGLRLDKALAALKHEDAALVCSHFNDIFDNRERVAAGAPIVAIHDRGLVIGGNPAGLDDVVRGWRNGFLATRCASGHDAFILCDDLTPDGDPVSRAWCPACNTAFLTGKRLYLLYENRPAGDRILWSGVTRLDEALERLDA
jgi:hypothetical protein